jgi:non-ribosomal peptide synthetase component F
LNTLIQGVWGLLLSLYSGQQDVLFGATVSGRPPELQGIEEMVGVFINTLPVRVRVRPELSVAEWLQQLQAEQLEARQYEHSPLAQVQSWSEVGRGRSLFESLMVFENYPVKMSAPSSQPDGGLGAWDISYLIRESYPMTLVAEPGAQLLLEIKYDNSMFDAGAIARISEHLELLFRNILTQRNVWHSALQEILDRTHTEQRLNDETRLREVRFQKLKQVKRKTVAKSV